MIDAPVCVHCRACNGEWSVATLPMELTACCRLMSAASRKCPHCGDTSGALMGRSAPPVEALST